MPSVIKNLYKKLYTKEYMELTFCLISKQLLQVWYFSRPSE
jgi:hypothetical protein